MNVTVQSIKFNADQKLIDFIKRKTAKLEQFLDNIIEGVCYLRLENVEDEANKIVELKFNIPGTQLFAKAQAKSFEEATDVAVESLRRQINKHKTKTRTAVSNHKELLSSEEEF
ncbi:MULTISPECIES: ribosome hibernation-promoting factor, HPF/YfiA family [Sphingobacterium]|jgi:putative sigma-54 modulation protein|uniref:Ribosome-associated translation inhibitor RaiA n=1 Tax=Sphingobacterium litopenaei TaxID=2763500 RepID=A0ABR7YDT4_9SPHI|nr:MULTISPECIES: ribosome-associated translation inhibitor RaiA [Sphingobacterium]MBD1429465.1 ribosome-associated translation inhibitor RaiA [Sphingobacterium litopenaei]NGM74810.1 ribosome-associated translation inhibitor RaiA [Sphingobacterium sp. SGL-16]